MSDWLTDWLAGWLADWQSDWLTDFLTDRQNDWMSDWLTDWLAGWLTEWQSDWLTGWLIDWLAVWLIDWLSDWLTDWLAGWLRTECCDWRTRWIGISWNTWTWFENDTRTALCKNWYNYLHLIRLTIEWLVLAWCWNIMLDMETFASTKWHFVFDEFKYSYYSHNGSCRMQLLSSSSCSKCPLATEVLSQ